MRSDHRYIVKYNRKADSKFNLLVFPLKINNYEIVKNNLL